MHTNEDIECIYYYYYFFFCAFPRGKKVMCHRFSSGGGEGCVFECNNKN